MSRPLYPNLPHKQKDKEEKVDEIKTKPIFEQAAVEKKEPSFFKRKGKVKNSID